MSRLLLKLLKENCGEKEKESGTLSTNKQIEQNETSKTVHRAEKKKGATKSLDNAETLK